MPGVITNITTAPTQSSTPTDTGKLFVVGQTERGSSTSPIVFHSFSEWKNACGAAIAGVYLSVGIECFFQEGGATLIMGRAVGSGAATAKVKAENEAAEANAVKFEAKSPGAWGNKLKVTIVKESAGKIGYKVLESGTLVEEALNFTTMQALEEYTATYSKYVLILNEAGKTGLPKEVAEATLSTGADGAAPVTSELETALSLFSKDYGGGQVAAPGYTAQAVQEAEMKHAETFNRFALLDMPLKVAGESVGSYMSTLKTRAAALQAKTGARRSAAFSTWAYVPSSVPLTQRLSPWSTTQAGIIARNDAKSSPPKVNQAAAGVNGRPRYVSSLATEYTATQRNELNESRINAVRVVPQLGIETYGNVTLTSQVTEPVWQQIGAVRLFNFVEVSGEAILEHYVFQEIDPHRELITQAGASLQAFLESLGNQLFNNAKEAVNVGPAVNTPETIAKKELIAAVEIKPSPSAETVILNITAQQ